MTAYFSGKNFLDQRPELKQSSAVKLHEERAAVLFWITIVFTVLVVLAAWGLGGPSGLISGRFGRGRHNPLVEWSLVAMLAIMSIVVAGDGHPDRRRRRQRPSGAAARSLLVRVALARGEQPPERLHPRRVEVAGGDRLVEPALGLARAVRAAARADVRSRPRGRGTRRSAWSGSTCASPKDRMPGVSMIQPPRAGQRQHERRRRGVPTASGDRVDDARPRGSASGTSALTSVDLPTPLCPTSTLVRPVEHGAHRRQVAAALGHHVLDVEVAVRREQGLRVGEVRLGQAQDRRHAARRTPPPGRGRSGRCGARGRPAR